MHWCSSIVRFIQAHIDRSLAGKWGHKFRGSAKTSRYAFWKGSTRMLGKVTCNMANLTGSRVIYFLTGSTIEGRRVDHIHNLVLPVVRGHWQDALLKLAGGSRTSAESKHCTQWPEQSQLPRFDKVESRQRKASKCVCSQSGGLRSCSACDIGYASCGLRMILLRCLS